jgi:hypothetical protein
LAAARASFLKAHGQAGVKTYQAIPIEECNDPHPLVAIPSVVVAVTEPHPYVVLGARRPWPPSNRRTSRWSAATSAAWPPASNSPGEPCA